MCAYIYYRSNGKCTNTNRIYKVTNARSKSDNGLMSTKVHVIALVIVLAALISVITSNSNIAAYAKKHSDKANDGTATPSKNDGGDKKAQDNPSSNVAPTEDQVAKDNPSDVAKPGGAVTPLPTVPTVAVVPAVALEQVAADCKTNPERCPPPEIPCKPGFKHNKHGECIPQISITVYVKRSGSKSGGSDVSNSYGKGNLQQIASGVSDFSNSNPGTIGLTFIKTSKDIAGWYHVKGEIRNNSPDTLTSLNIKTHWYDAGMNIVGITASGYTDPLNVESGRTATFDALQDPNDFTDKPKFYKLSYDWNQ